MEGTRAEGEPMSATCADRPLRRGTRRRAQRAGVGGSPRPGPQMEGGGRAGAGSQPEGVQGDRPQTGLQRGDQHTRRCRASGAGCGGRAELSRDSSGPGQRAGHTGGGAAGPACGTGTRDLGSRRGPDGGSPEGGTRRRACVRLASPPNRTQVTRAASRSDWTTGTSRSATRRGGVCWRSPAGTASHCKAASRLRAPPGGGTRRPPSAKVSHFTPRLRRRYVRTASFRCEFRTNATQQRRLWAGPPGEIRRGFLSRPRPQADTFAGDEASATSAAAQVTGEREKSRVG